MRSSFIVLTVSLISLLLSATVGADVYKWKDRYGKTQYGDKPPEGAKIEPFKAPPITVIQNYGQQWQSSGQQAPPTRDTQPRPSAGRYTALSIVAPKGGQAIRANDGDVTLMLSIQPKLQKGHSIVVFLDGKQVSNGTSRAVNLTALDRGLHQVHAEIRDAYKTTLMSSPSVSFTVLRTSILTNKLNKKKRAYP
jgi:hypothetical protein